MQNDRHVRRNLSPAHLDWIFLSSLCFHDARDPWLCYLRARAQKLRRQGKKTYFQEELDPTSIFQVIFKSIQRPLCMIFTESVVFVATLWSAFSLGTIYLFTQSAEQVFGDLYGWGPVKRGYVQASNVVGELIGWVYCLLINPVVLQIRSSEQRNAWNRGSRGSSVSAGWRLHWCDGRHVCLCVDILLL